MPAISIRWPRRATATGIRTSSVDICDRAAIDDVFAELPARRRAASRRREPCRPLDRRRRATSSRPMSSAPTRCSRRRSPIGAGSTRTRAPRFRFQHVSTDEVFGSLGADRQVQRDDALRSPTRPIPPARRRPTIWCAPGTTPMACRSLVTNCSNNYGPYHFPEKLIPLMIIRALDGERLPVYGKGENVRDWLHVEDHAEALIARCCARAGPARPTTSAATASARTSTSCARSARCSTSWLPDSPNRPHDRLIEFVTDRPGPRRALCHRRLRRSQRELGWRPRAHFRGRPAPDRALVSRQQGLVGARHERRLPRRATRAGELI